jgi:hypothetical protein
MKNSFITHTLYPLYVKKEDAIEVIRRQHRIIAGIMLSSTLLMAVIQLVVVPKLVDFYIETDLMSLVEQFVHKTSQISTVSIILIISVSTYLLINEHNISWLRRHLKKYQKHEMIRTSELIRDSQIIVMGVMVLFVEYLTFSTIMSFYSYMMTR